jgi:hypothetical protein
MMVVTEMGHEEPRNISRQNRRRCRMRGCRAVSDMSRWQWQDFAVMGRRSLTMWVGICVYRRSCAEWDVAGSSFLVLVALTISGLK